MAVNARWWSIPRRRVAARAGLAAGSARTFGIAQARAVDKDRSMEAMIKNDEEKVWMTPLLDLRNELGEPHDRHRHDYRRMDGRVQIFHDSTVPGPYTKKWREHWLRRVLEVQREVRAVGPPEMAGLTLISLEEVHEIRRLWLDEKHEFDDAAPRIYRDVTGQELPMPPADDHLLGHDDWELLRGVCGEDEAFFELAADMLDVERQFRGMTRRAGIFDALEECLKAGQYASEEEAIRIRREQEARLEASKGAAEPEPQRTLFSEEEPMV
jgi:DNA sulfur modification protein DndC